MSASAGLNAGNNPELSVLCCDRCAWVFSLLRVVSVPSAPRSQLALFLPALLMYILYIGSCTGSVH